jgi:hypothetical protein
MTAPPTATGDPRLHYGITHTPSNPPVSDDTTPHYLTLRVYMDNKTGQDIPVTSITISLPVGNGAGDLIQPGAAADINYQIEKGHTRWTGRPDSSDTAYTVTLTPPPKKEFFPTGNSITVTLSRIRVNTVQGSATVTVTETTPSGPPTPLDHPVPKVAARVRFAALKPRLPLIDAGAQTQLDWTADIPPTVTHYEACLSWTTDFGPQHANVTDCVSWPVCLHRDTAFTLSATITDTHGSSTPVLATVITVNSPHITATNATVHATIHLLHARQPEEITQQRTRGHPAPDITRTATTDGLLSISLRTQATTAPTIGISLYHTTPTALYTTTATGPPAPASDDPYAAPRLTLPVPTGHTITLTDLSPDLDYQVTLDWRPLGTGTLTPAIARPERPTP